MAAYVHVDDFYGHVIASDIEARGRKLIQTTPALRIVQGEN